jgi:aspartate/methionine/tyrosine aminotransferase
MQLPHYKLLRYFAQFEFSTPYPLSASDCEPLSIGDLLSFEEDADQKFHKIQLGYPLPQGNFSLRKQITKDYTHLNPDQLILTAGSEEAIFLCLSALLKKGDHVIVQAPCYQPYYEIPKALGCEVSLWNGKEEDGWELDLSELQNTIQKNTKLILISLPSHPTGYLMSSKKLFDLVEIARGARIPIFCDESYSGLEFHAQEKLPKICDLYELGISIGTLSKVYGLPGLRLGWIATHGKVLLHEIVALKDYTTLSCSAPSEFLGELALRHAEHILQKNRKLVQSNFELLQRFFKKHSDVFDCRVPHAGCLAFAKLKKNADADQFCADLYEKTQVLCVPSTCFDYGKKHVRIGFGRKSFSRSLDQLEKYLEMGGNMRRKAS